MPWQSKWRTIDTIKPGKVYLVQSRTDGCLAALKTGREQGIDIAREIVALERLNAVGASVPKLLEHNSPLYIVMEFIAGGTIREFSKTNTVTVDQLSQITDVVHAAHAAGIAHRDLSHHNILIRSGGTPVVCDWASGLLLEPMGTPIEATTPEAWREAAAGDLRSVENLPETLFREFVAPRT